MRTNEPPVIETRSLRFAYRHGFRKTSVLHGIDLDIRRGEFVGLMGHNGSGKTTLLSILSTLFPSFQGSIHINGFNLRKQPSQVRSQISVLLEENAVDDLLSGYENLYFYAKINHLQDASNRILALARMFAIDDKLNDKIESYSKGMRRKLELARCLLDPSKNILLLDEPTESLDESGRKKAWSYLQKLRDERGTTALIITHSLAEAQYLCDRVIVLKEGMIEHITPSKKPEKEKRILMKGLDADAANGSGAGAARRL
ncbi:MAG: ABC transporter ATP-binding protein [archaeon]